MKPVIIMSVFAVVMVFQIMVIRGDFGRPMQQGSCLFWNLSCK